ncbi:MAG: methylmalonyl Co-A mutase-associated GTPase MeaB [Bacteroidia bacterium]
MPDLSKQSQFLHYSNKRFLARCISLVENQAGNYQEILTGLQIPPVPVIGITGPPGAGKSTLINALLKKLTDTGKSVGVIAVDPSSPFNFGSLLGDRIRMGDFYNHPNVFIRSLASRGSLGGLSLKAFEVVDVMKAAGFDYVIIETVGVGQSEVEIAGLADTVVVALVPESGDEIQVIKAGLMEIADIFVVNKADRPGAEIYIANLRKMVKHGSDHNWQIPVVQTSALKNEGIDSLIKSIKQHINSGSIQQKKLLLMAEKAYRLIQQQRMKDIQKEVLIKELEIKLAEPSFNIYKYISENF